MRKTLPLWSRLQKHINYRRLQADDRSVAMESCLSVARPHISLKARMLGGQAETITRLGGTVR